MPQRHLGFGGCAAGSVEWGVGAPTPQFRRPLHGVSNGAPQSPGSLGGGLGNRGWGRVSFFRFCAGEPRVGPALGPRVGAAQPGRQADPN